MIVVKRRTKIRCHFIVEIPIQLLRKLKKISPILSSYISNYRGLKKKNVISREDFFVKIIKIRIFEFLKPSEKKKKNLDFTAIFEWLIGRSSVN